MKTQTTIKSQKGFQSKFLSSSADIVIGLAPHGTGKTYALLMDAVTDTTNPEWRGVIFRKTERQIKSPGGLWDASKEIYQLLGAEPITPNLKWVFPSLSKPDTGGAELRFAELERKERAWDYAGSQIPYIGFDELTEFSDYIFFYLLSRNRSHLGIKSRVRATACHDPKSWVAEFTAWWIEQETGLPMPERDGVFRYFVRTGDKYIWGDTAEEVCENAYLNEVAERHNLNPKDFVKSVTCVSGNICQNEELLKANPEYLAGLSNI